MTRVFLAAGVASLAIAAPAVAGPHGQHGGGQAAFVSGGRGGGHNGGGSAAQRMDRQSFAPRMQRQSFAAPRMGHQQRRFTAIERPQRAGRFGMRAQSRAMHVSRTGTRMAARGQVRSNRVRESRIAGRQRLRTNRVQQAHNLRTLRMQTRTAARDQLRANTGHGQKRMAMTHQLQTNRIQVQNNLSARQQLRSGRQMGAQNLLAQRRALRVDRIANAEAFRTSNFASLVRSPANRVVAPADAIRFVGQPVSSVGNFVTLNALPASVSYLYPPTPYYYYQYGGGYLYQIDRDTSLIDALIPLLAGGFLPGTYLPQPFMSSYVPAYYGLDSFYPASFDYGFGYGNVCNRYAYGVVYQVDCFTGMVENVIPTYAGGYGVGQMLPSAYSYYNVPMQYRSLYYPTADYSYWYAPGAIYQYDPRSSLITSVAALMSPGFTIGQPLPVGYSMYNVPLAYRSTYYDTPNAWYRYNNGYIYQVDPSTMLVTSIVASLLT
ncbi:MAG TPA: hypothetical protein VHU79_08290 [Sphingomicrobium sp.]|nr:hypothetical protein [Sphingomicrobium sp.]